MALCNFHSLGFINQSLFVCKSKLKLKFPTLKNNERFYVADPTIVVLLLLFLLAIKRFVFFSFSLCTKFQISFITFPQTFPISLKSICKCLAKNFELLTFVNGKKDCGKFARKITHLCHHFKSFEAKKMA